MSNRRYDTGALCSIQNALPSDGDRRIGEAEADRGDDESGHAEVGVGDDRGARVAAERQHADVVEIEEEQRDQEEELRPLRDVARERAHFFADHGARRRRERLQQAVDDASSGSSRRVRDGAMLSRARTKAGK